MVAAAQEMVSDVVPGPVGDSWSTPVIDTVMHEVLGQRSFLVASAVLGIVSGAVALLTYFVMLVFGLARAQLYTIVEVRQHDQLYQWLLDWLAAQREVHERGSHVFGEVHPDFHKVAKVSKTLRMRFLPVDDGSFYMFRMGGSLVWVSNYLSDRHVPTKGGMPMSEARLRVAALGRSKHTVNALFQAAFDHNTSKLSGNTEVFVAQPHEHAEHSHWRRLEPCRTRPLSTVVASSEPGPQELLDDMQAFLAREDWYAQRGIPYRRGYLFHGPPGCGKTSFVTAVAGKLNCPIFVLNLADPYLSDLGLLKLVTDASPRSLLLLEDVDAAFHEVLGKAGTTPSGGNTQRDGAHMGQLTFSGVLNALDGVAGQEGKIVIMTTNHPEKLDPALVRPGRVDMRAKFHCASTSAIEEIFCNFFQDGGLGAAELRRLAGKFSGHCIDGTLPIASVQGHLMQFIDDPHAAADSNAPAADQVPSAMRQFVVPRGAAHVGGGEEE